MDRFHMCTVSLKMHMNIALAHHNRVRGVLLCLQGLRGFLPPQATHKCAMPAVAACASGTSCMLVQDPQNPSLTPSASPPPPPEYLLLHGNVAVL